MGTIGSLIVGFIAGVLVGNGIRIIYHAATNKDIPLLKYPYITFTDGTLQRYHAAMKGDLEECLSIVKYQQAMNQLRMCRADLTEQEIATRLKNSTWYECIDLLTDWVNLAKAGCPMPWEDNQ